MQQRALLCVNPTRLEDLTTDIKHLGIPLERFKGAPLEECRQVQDWKSLAF